MSNKKALRVVHVVSDMHRGGAETMIMNLYRNIDRDKLQFDFICHYHKDDLEGMKKRPDYADEIESLGGRIFRIPSLGSSNPLEYVNNVRNVLRKEGPFEAIHVHTNKQAGFSLLGAKLAGVKKRIVHSHTASWDTYSKPYMNILKFMIKITANKYCACGTKAAESAFGIIDNMKGEVKILSNAIDSKQFLNINYDEMENLKKELKIDNNIKIIGHVGRLDIEKNHKFILDLAKYMSNNNREFLILLVGTGPLEMEIKENIRKLNLDKYVKLLGVRSDINVLMNMFDVFLLPSLFEGLPLVTVEAQAAGTRCIVSDTVTNEIDMGLGLVTQLPIEKNSFKEWENAIFNNGSIQKDKDKILNKLTLKGYDVSQNVSKLYELYEI